jgi:hypothetical protein
MSGLDSCDGFGHGDGMNSRPKLSRRAALKTIVGSSVAASLAGCATGQQGNPNLIVNENARPGTRDWMLRKTGH